MSLRMLLLRAHSVHDEFMACRYDLQVALRGFAPAPLLALRILKAETQVGLSVDTIKMLEHKFGGKKEWMVTGDYAIVQFDA